MNTFTKIIFSTLFFFCFSLQTKAAVIKQVKNKKVLIQLDGTSANVGDQFYGISKNNKKTSILKITAVKNGKAIAVISKGQAVLNDSVQLAKASSVATTTTSKTAAFKPKIQGNQSVTSVQTDFNKKNSTKLSFNFNLANDLISAKQQAGNSTAEETVDMVGTNFGANIQYDYPLTDWISAKGFAGVEMLKVAKTSLLVNTCGNHTTSECNADITYLTLGALFKAGTMFSKHQLWGGLGFGIKQPLAKQSTALKEEDIAMTTALIAAIGFDFQISNSSFIPISFEYHKALMAESETVPTISHMAVSLGYGFNF